jgi:uncharacterized protein YlxW (UPF0749 family)
MDGLPATDGGETLQRLQDWVRGGSELCRRLGEHLRVLQEQVEAGRIESDHWRQQAAAAAAESERLREEIRQLQGETERLQRQQQEWDGMIASVDEITRRMNDMILKLRESRPTVP